jgi:uncharacterized protein VirK/YbjX
METGSDTMTALWAWRASKHVDPRLKMRVKYVATALLQPSASRQLALAERSSPIGELLAEWPTTAGILVWPYQCAAWDAETRVKRMADHLDVVGKIPGLKLKPDEKVLLADLGSFSPGASLILDRASWLSREGHLTISLFKEHFRAFTVSFSLFGYPETELFIGGLQGRHGDEILAMYRDLTKDFNGMRPRDFMLEMLRMFAVKIGVRRIFAVADDSKIFRHPYFGDKAGSGLPYDEVWLERGGERVSATHFELPLSGSRRPIDEVAPKKRSMYRRRYEMLDQIEAMLPRDLASAERTQFEAR